MSDLFKYTNLNYLLSLRAVSSTAAFVAIGLLQGNAAQANPSESLSSQVVAQEQKQLADIRVSAPDREAIPIGIAAASTPAKSFLPQLQDSQPAYKSEDDLIQKMSGKANVVREKASQQVPVLAPSSAGLPSQLPQAAASDRTSEPVLVTATTNSDVGLGLVPAKQPPMHFSAPSSGVRSVNPDSFKYSPTAQLATPALLPLNETNSKAGLLSQSSNRNGAGLLTSPDRPLLRSTALTPYNLTVQGVYLYQGDQTSARARLTGTYPLTPNVLFGATVDVVTGNAFTDTPNAGFNITELYLATSLRDIPNLRFTIGQLDLTSYFDRNSFAKDGASQFFNPVFQTNPALSATGIASRPGLLVNWSVTDSIEAKAAVFSSARGLSDFSLDGFAGELGIRRGNGIIRGTYVTDRDSGSRSGFREIFQLARGNNRTGLLKADREESFGVNAEYFFPKIKMGVFGRYGRYNNRDLDIGGDTYSAGLTFLDVFAADDRLGLAYGRDLSNDNLRRRGGDNTPDVLELFYDFRLVSNLRVGFSVQERNNFSEIVAGVRVRTEFDVTPKGRLVQ
ncbi:MAG: carbohydrate porin [Phormidesmis sp. CAN_BIN36]|nr:carbohydrate porin [Phormidesmis sp. CAN_BIN36]